MEKIKGYTYGEVAQSPVSLADLELLKKTVLFSSDDEKHLQLAGEVLKDQTNEVLDCGTVLLAAMNIWFIISERAVSLTWNTSLL